jgi:hypothetical protein
MKKPDQKVGNTVQTTEFTFDLPGNHRIDHGGQVAVTKLKEEYNVILRLTREANKKKAASTDKQEKSDYGKMLDHFRKRRKELLSRIAIFSDDEKLYGFKEVKNAD